MRLPRPLLRTVALVLTTAGLLIVAWYFQPQAYDTVRQADRLTVYEGLPHPMYEEWAFQEELETKQTMQLSGYPFYREPLDVKVKDLKTLRELLGDRGTYKTYTGEKKCGGFHPDYAVEWSIKGKVYRCLICFGCSEARFDGPKGESLFYDLRFKGNFRDQRLSVLDLLKAYRKHRPPHERFGIGPLAGKAIPPSDSTGHFQP